MRTRAARQQAIWAGISVMCSVNHIFVLFAARSRVHAPRRRVSACPPHVAQATVLRGASGGCGVLTRGSHSEAYFKLVEVSACETAVHHMPSPSPPLRLPEEVFLVLMCVCVCVRARARVCVCLCMWHESMWHMRHWHWSRAA